MQLKNKEPTMNITTVRKTFLTKKTHFLSALMLIMAMMFSAIKLNAAPISVQKARSKASSFLTMRYGMLANELTGISLEEVESPCSEFYIFNIGKDKGFIIIAADDAVYTVLGYSGNGSFDAATMNDSMKTWLKGYSNAIISLQQSDEYAMTTLPERKYMTPIRKNIEALVPSQWNQRTPFNNLCPIYDNDTENRPTGCVATAMAQVMYYHAWPQDYTSKLPSYTFTDNPLLGGGNKERFMPELPSVKFDWNAMKDIYENNMNDEAANTAVAQLMQYCGQSVRMMYCPQASGALSFNIPNALREYFGYDKGVRYVDRDEYSTEQWEDLIYKEVSEGRPVLYSGSAKTGGHQFICDGYENGFFHFNWGWSGMSDGFFRLSVLNPAMQGVGGAGDGMNFSDAQEAVIGICHPIEGSVLPEEYPSISTLSTDIFDGKYARNANGDTENINVLAHFAYSKTISEVYNIALAFCDNNIVENIISETKMELKAGDPLNDHIFSFSLTSDDIKKYDGHTINVVYKNGEGEWVLMKNYERVYMKFSAASDYVLIQAEPKKDITISNISIEGPQCAGVKMTLVAKVINNGEEIGGNANVMIDGKPSIFNTSVTIDKNSNDVITIPFEVPAKDEVKISLGLNGSVISEAITINPKQINRSKLSFEEGDNTICGGDYISIELNVTNKKTYEYHHAVGMSLYEKDKITGDTYLVQTKEQYIELDASATQTVNFTFESLKPDTEYSVSCHYYYNNSIKYLGGYGTIFASYRTLDSAIAYMSNGIRQVVDEKDGSFIIPSEACFVYMPVNAEGKNFTMSNNPNCLYYFSEGTSVPSSFDSVNVIADGKAAKITISALYDYYCPIEYVVSEIHLNKIITDGTSSLCIPFTPSEMAIEGSFVSFGDDIRLLQYTAESDDVLYFDYAENIKASVPYLVYTDKKYDGKTITFTAYDADVRGVAVSVPGKRYAFCGSLSTNTSANAVYMLSENAFVLSESCTTIPFEAYCMSFIPNNDRKEISISLPEDIDTSISEIEQCEIGMVVTVYDIQGIAVKTVIYGDDMLEGLPSGIYVVNGKKYIRK